MLYPRVLVATGVLNSALLPQVAQYLALPGLVALVATVVGLRGAAGDDAPASEMSNPLQLTSALHMALVFQVVLMLVSFARGTWGQTGVYSSAMILGLTDVDALTVSMARDVAHTSSVETAAVAIALGVLTNTVLKLAFALLLGSPLFRRIAGSTLFVMILAAVAALAML